MAIGTAKFVLQEKDILKVSSLSTVNIVEISPLEKIAKTNTPAIDNYVTIKKDGVALVETTDTMIDNEESIGKFAISNNNVIKLIVDNVEVDDLDKAIAEFSNLEITYQLSEDIKLDTDKYLLTVTDSNGNLIHPTVKVTLEQANGIITTLDTTRDIGQGGYLIHELTHSYTIG